MKNNISTLKGLIDANLIEAQNSDDIAPIIAEYKLSISGALHELIAPNDKNDPIYKQFVPDIRESIAQDYEIYDPIGDDIHSPMNGLVHRYTDRVLLKLTANCPIYCRFCFRREMVGKPQSRILSQSELEKIYNYLAQHNEIREVIFTGGDPLMLPPAFISKVCENLAKINHISKLRTHSRIVTGVPKLINKKLIDALQQSGKELIIALHINHVNEISDAAKAKIKLLGKNSIKLISQTVLLAGVNDNAQALGCLMKEFIKLGIRPYYLHHPDLARGTGHFQLDFETGMKIFAQLQSTIPIKAMPRYIIDIPGGHGKVDVNRDNIHKQEDNSYRIKDPNSNFHNYPKLAF